MEVGDYVRTDDGLIGKVVSEPYNYKDSIGCDIDFGNNDIYNEYEMYQNIIKTSPSIIDILEVGDYVNGERVTQVTNAYIEVCYGRDSTDFIKEKDIKAIVTKEQFSSIEYKLGE